MWIVLALGWACQPPEPQPVHQTAARAAEFAAQGQLTWAPERTAFDWIPTVWAYGLHVYAEQSADPAPVAWRDAWLGHHNPRYTGDAPARFTSSDTLSPALHAALANAENPGVYAPILAAADAYLTAVPRTTDGALPHWGPDNAFGFDADQVWLDTQFMVGLLWLSRGQTDAFATQHRLLSRRLRDPNTGLYWHAWDASPGVTIPNEATFWARGNAWVLVAAAEAVHTLPASDPLRDEVAADLRAHADALLAVQAEDGLWHTVLNQPRGADPANYTETSAAALIVYGLIRGREAGVLGDEVLAPIAAALSALDQRVWTEADGSHHLSGASSGTNPGDYDYYVGIIQLDDLMLGHGAALMAWSAADGLPMQAP